MIRPFRRLAAVVALFALTIVPLGAARLHDLHGLDDLKAAFNRDAGKVRLILLVSPT
ncbi:MAG TPA: hypothetical protein VFA27_15350 [Vicinamibacterales bacterium]|nr:hypothetical protein [Vicinamibacterales bacterium]